MAGAQSSGTLLYRKTAGKWEVLLVHPSGSYNRNKPWSIPKGLPEEGEALEDAARRETKEETGVDFRGSFIALGSSQYQKKRKTVHCFAALVSPEINPTCASWEVDRAEFVPLDNAFHLLHADQRIFLGRLETLLMQAEEESAPAIS